MRNSFNMQTPAYTRTQKHTKHLKRKQRQQAQKHSNSGIVITLNQRFNPRYTRIDKEFSSKVTDITYGVCRLI